MKHESLRAVLTVDEQTKVFTPVAHNLPREKAETKAAELRNQGVQAQVLFQTSRHKGRAGTTCKPCKNAAENLSQKALTGLAEKPEGEEDKFE